MKIHENYYYNHTTRNLDINTGERYLGVRINLEGS